MAEAGSNGFEPCNKHFEAFDDIDAKLEAEKIAYMNKCRELRDAQKRVKKMVKAEGFAVTAFDKVVKTRRLLKKIEAIDAEAAEDDDAESYEQMQAALGMFSDTPLGAAALSSAQAKGADKKARNKAAINSLTKPKAQQVESNVVALTAGIRQLPEDEDRGARNGLPAREDDDDRDLRPRHMIDAEKAREADDDDIPATLDRRAKPRKYTKKAAAAVETPSTDEDAAPGVH